MGKPGKSKLPSSAGPGPSPAAADKSKAKGTKQDSKPAAEKSLKPQKAGVKKPKPEEVHVAPGGSKAKKQGTDEIDSIFSAKKKAPASTTDTKDTNADNKDPKRPKVLGTKDDLFGEEAGKGRKKTEEGWNIYTEDELGLNKQGGDTDLCPFDCDCCF